MREELYTCGSFKWIDLSNPSSEELQTIQTEFDLPPSSVQDCLDPVHLPKFERYKNVSFFILRIYDLDASKDADSILDLTRKIAVFVGPVRRLRP